MVEDEVTIRTLSFLLRTYDGVNRQLGAAKNRLQALNPDADKEKHPIITSIAETKNRLTRTIDKEIKYWTLWTEWLEKVNGIGPFIGGNLILMYYYKFIPICKDCGADLENVDGTFKCSDCGKSAKKGGILSTRIEYRDFPNVSKWWAFTGRGADENGNMPKRQKGVRSNWSSKGRTVTWQIGDQFNRRSGEDPYKAYLLDMKYKHERNNGKKKWTKGHIHNAAKHESIKLFLSHFWHVARELAGKSTEGPYIQIVGGHTGIIPPYYWK